MKHKIIDLQNRIENQLNNNKNVCHLFESNCEELDVRQETEKIIDSQKSVENELKYKSILFRMKLIIQIIVKQKSIAILKTQKKNIIKERLIKGKDFDAIRRTVRLIIVQSKA